MNRADELNEAADLLADAAALAEWKSHALLMLITEARRLILKAAQAPTPPADA